jgi:hypothetical protein
LYEGFFGIYCASSILFYRADVSIFQALRLMKSQIAGKDIEAQQAAHVAELENDNA